MRVLDLFSGIGGFSLGLERAGMRTVAFCEIEKYPSSILRKHWPDVPIFEDIRRLHAEELPEPIDLICGGYPCQPFSLAGKRRGKDDDRHLWPEVVRLIRELSTTTGKPSWCVFENVPGHISMGLDEVLSDLEGEGYTCWPVIIPACAVNAPHRRDRVWIIANSHGAGLQEARSEQQATGIEQHGEVDYNVAHAERNGLQGKRENRTTERPIGLCHREGGDEIKDISTSSWSGRPEEWTTEPPVCGADDGVSNRVARLKALGNAVVPQIPELLGRIIMAVERTQNDR